MNKNIFLELSGQNIVHILESLSLYKDLALVDQYKYLIDNLIININKQLDLQGINVYVNKTRDNIIGKSCVISDVNINDLSTTDVEGIIIGVSDINNFIKVIISRNNKLTTIDVPMNLITIKE